MGVAGDFVVYACSDCGKRIFTEQAYVGRSGRCPCCGHSHIVGGASTAELGDERRKSARVKDKQTRVGVDPGSSGAVLTSELLPLGDLSETGVSFEVDAVKDSRKLSGYRPPDVKVGHTLQISLHLPGPGKPKAYRAEVKRVVESGKGKYLIGAQFFGMDSHQEEGLRRLVDKMLEKRDRDGV